MAPTAGSVSVMRPAVTIEPPAFTIFIGKTVQLNAAVADVSDQAVTWSVTEADCGAVSDSGLYTAPEALPIRRLVTCGPPARRTSRDPVRLA